MKTTDFIILILLAIFVFADTIRIPFLWDDKSLIEKNIFIRKPTISTLLQSANWKNFRHTKTEYDVGLKPVSPLRTLSFILDYKLWGLNPAGFHLTNLILNLVNVILVYLLCYQLFGDRKVALFTGLLFATYPMHVETVAWIKNRVDLFTAVFYLLSLIFFIKHELTRINTRINTNKTLISIFCFILALLSKEMAVTLPAILVLYIICFFPRKEWRARILSTIPYWVITALYIGFEFFYLDAQKIVSQVSERLTFGAHILIVIESIAYYFKLLLVPFWFNAERFVWIPESLLEHMVIISIIAVGLYFGVVYSLRQDKKLVFSLLFVLIALLPISNVVFLATRPIAEQRLYIPSIGFCIFCGLIISTAYKWVKKGYLVTICAVVLLCGYSVSTMRRVCDWRNPITFWESSVKASPLAFRTHYNLGCAYLEYDRIDDAIKSLRKAEQIDPTQPLLLQTLSVLYIDANRYTDAILLLKKALQKYPEFDNAHANLGWMYYKIGKKADAIKHLKKAIAINPGYGLPHTYLAEIYKADAKITEAIQEYRTALEIDLYPWEVHRNLIALLEQEKRFDEAIEEYKKALTLNPYYSGEIYNSLGIVYVQKKMFKSAEEAFNKALELNPQDSITKNNLFELHKMIGQTGAAITHP